MGYRAWSGVEVVEEGMASFEAACGPVSNFIYGYLCRRDGCVRSNSPATLGCHDAKEAITIRLLDNLILPDGDDDDAGADGRDAQREHGGGECGGPHGGWMDGTGLSFSGGSD